ncbi:cell envelope biogenesis protein OmpA [Nocardioides carbamazepini]|uniref:DUF6069 family protein n=1 Tax=Nocardioides carbamazepini TaxID=2854259 RepID=UPI00214A419F|nr:DUF6069 family protein [Nocardioides carbamazepini]MCR1785021.1 cell envelope biogenesis protein OmpA [Nocardioides carbamazepini]
MSTTTDLPVPTTAAASAVSDRPTVWRHGLAAAAGASVVTTTLAAIASAAGVSFADGTGVSLPVLAFTQLTFVFSMIGVGLAAVLARRARRPRSTFVRTTLALAGLSVVPDATFGFDVASALTLMALHAVAAAIVIPVLARRLARRASVPA